MLRTEINKWKHKFVILKKVYLSIISTVNRFELKNKTNYQTTKIVVGPAKSWIPWTKHALKFSHKKKYLVKFQSLDRLSISK